MTLQGLKEFALTTLEKLKRNNRSKPYIEGQLAGIFKMWRELRNESMGSEEYEEYLDVFMDVLDQI